VKLVKQDLATGRMIVIPQDADDLYTLFNIISPGDKLKSKTSRRIKRGESGGDDSSRTSVTITIQVEDINFQGFGEMIRVKGKILEASDPQISLSSYHTLKIELLRQISIEKSKWSKFELEKIESSQLGTPSGLVIVAIDDQSAIVSQVGSHATRILLDLEPTIPRKGSDVIQHTRSMMLFFADLSQFLNDLHGNNVLEYLIIGGPGFTYESFVDYLKDSYAHLTKNFSSVATNNSGRSGIQEILTSHLPDSFVAGKSAQMQAKLIQRILDELGKDTGLIAYGSDVNYAASVAAIDQLLILDTKLHESLEKRSQLTELMDHVKQNRGKVVLMSSLHDSGEILKGLGGIVSILRFRLPAKT
jgi:protein pelota